MNGRGLTGGSSPDVWSCHEQEESSFPCELMVRRRAEKKGFKLRRSHKDPTHTNLDISRILSR